MVSGEGYNGEGDVRPVDSISFSEAKRQQMASLTSFGILANEAGLNKG